MKNGIGKSHVVAIVLSLIAFGASQVDASVYTVGDLPPIGGDDFFSASWLHDASGARNVSSGTEANGAYRSGKISGAITGSLYGNAVDGRLSGIGGTLNGNLSNLLKNLNADLRNQNFVLRLGADIDSSHTGALKFNADGNGGPGAFTGGYIDYLLEVPGVPSFSLSGTFFFKPQAETGSSSLSPNRGDSSAFTLWGYNWMHDSGPIDGSAATVDWLSFLGDLGYTGGLVNRSSYLDGGHSLGIALFASGQQPHTAAQPEPTTYLVWCGLSMIALAVSSRARAIA